MGAVAILADAVVWACTTTLITSRLTRIDFLSVATFRLIFATAFIWPALFILGGQDDLWSMSFHTVWQLFLGALAGYTLAEPGYALTLALLGLTRGYTLVIGLFSLAAFVMPVIFLDETVSWQAALGGVLIIAGVTVVTFRGRKLRTSALPDGPRAPEPAGSGAWPPAGYRLPHDAVAEATPSVRMSGTPSVLPRLPAGVVVGVATAILWAAATVVLRMQPSIRIPGTPVVLPRLLATVAVGVVAAALWEAATTILCVRPAAALSDGKREPEPAKPDDLPSDGQVRPSVVPTAAMAPVRIPGTPVVLPRIIAGIAVGSVTAILWATGTTILRAVTPGIDAAAVATVQLTPAVAVSVLVFLLVRRGRVFGDGVTLGTVSLIGLTGMLTAGLGTMLVVFAVQRIGAGPTAVLFAMSTIFALPLGVIFLKERVTIWGVAGAAVAVGGVALLVI
ncbi:MAG: DMT family transporter [Chloroflexi bacterium]|nr:DMT family transporter [Chloroflexota bacterium]